MKDRHEDVALLLTAATLVLAVETAVGALIIPEQDGDETECQLSPRVL